MGVMKDYKDSQMKDYKDSQLVNRIERAMKRKAPKKRRAPAGGAAKTSFVPKGEAKQ